MNGTPERYEAEESGRDRGTAEEREGGREGGKEGGREGAGGPKQRAKSEKELIRNGIPQREVFPFKSKFASRARHAPGGGERCYTAHFELCSSFFLIVADHYPPEQTHHHQSSLVFLEVKKLRNATESPRLALACNRRRPGYLYSIIEYE
jgi:hypothetical protein